MVLCIIALPLFAFLGIFSVRYRKLTKKALDCLLKTVTLRKCETGLDTQIKAAITGTLLGIWPAVGRAIHKYFKLFSWLFVILMVWSAYASGVGIYNYWAYGNCNGPESTGFCMLDPTGSHSGLSTVSVVAPDTVTLPTVDDDDPIRGSSDAELTIIQFGCFQCPYTAQAEEIVTEVLDHYEGRVNLQFKSFSIPHHYGSFHAARAGQCAFLQGQYEEYHKTIFERQQIIVANETYSDIAEELGLNRTAFDACLNDPATFAEVREDIDDGFAAGVVGTPTFFINDKKIVGPKPFRTFKRIIDKELK